MSDCFGRRGLKRSFLTSTVMLLSARFKWAFQQKATFTKFTQLPSSSPKLGIQHSNTLGGDSGMFQWFDGQHKQHRVRYCGVILAKGGDLALNHAAR